MRSAHGTISRLLGLILLFLAAACLDTLVVRAQSTERKVLKKIDVNYPDLLKKSNIGGTVRLRVLVKADGTVKSIEVAGGNPILADAARSSVMQWKFATASAESMVDVAVVFDPSANK
jgi:TonB family protein